MLKNIVKRIIDGVINMITANDLKTKGIVCLEERATNLRRDIKLNHSLLNRALLSTDKGRKAKAKGLTLVPVTP